MNHSTSQARGSEIEASPRVSWSSDLISNCAAGRTVLPPAANDRSFTVRSVQQAAAAIAYDRLIVPIASFDIPR
jgi:hypothetical protein